jgi:hypothetical protein
MRAPPQRVDAQRVANPSQGRAGEMRAIGSCLPGAVRPNLTQQPVIFAFSVAGAKNPATVSPGM